MFVLQVDMWQVKIDSWVEEDILSFSTASRLQSTAKEISKQKKQTANKL